MFFYCQSILMRNSFLFEKSKRSINCNTNDRENGLFQSNVFKSDRIYTRHYSLNSFDIHMDNRWADGHRDFFLLSGAIIYQYTWPSAIITNSFGITSNMSHTVYIVFLFVFSKYSSNIPFLDKTISNVTWMNNRIKTNTNDLFTPVRETIYDKMMFVWS